MTFPPLTWKLGGLFSKARNTRPYTLRKVLIYQSGCWTVNLKALLLNIPCKTDLTAPSNGVTTWPLPGKIFIFPSHSSYASNFQSGNRTASYHMEQHNSSSKRVWRQLRRQHTSRTTIGMSYMATFCATSCYGFSQWIILCYMSRLKGNHFSDWVLYFSSKSGPYCMYSRFTQNVQSCKLLYMERNIRHR